MKKFDFRLEKVLEYRRMVEDWAKDTYLDAKSKRLEGEAVQIGLLQERTRLLESTITTIDDCQVLDLRLTLLEDQILHQKLIVNVLLDEEAGAQKEWTNRRMETKALEELRGKAYEEWQLEMNRQEQAALDEWAVQRRVA